MNTKAILQFRSFLILLTLVSLAFAWILLPFYGAVFWGVVLAILFAPVQRHLLAKTQGRRSLSALITLLIIILIVIIPVILITGSVIQQIAELYQEIDSGQLNPGAYLQQILNALPQSAHTLLQHIGVESLSDLQQKFSRFVLESGQALTKQALNLGQNTFQFIVSLGIMLYMLFFLLRDGVELGRHCRELIPLGEDHKTHLFRKLTTVVRATIKGNIAVAATQGALGGIIFWFLDIQGALFWGVLMAILSLLPAVGASLIWAPVAIYFFVAGQLFEGIVLTSFGIFVIGLVDNVLRPLLVGKDTKIPDYIILISTLGGLSIFGLNGFVIGPLIAAIFMACWDLFPSAIRARAELNHSEHER
ncbi:AI-2E family transporter [Alcaligenes endophyticus]|uniref:AI-2E family transporter n=1 Tax=Alcaligenes endophyticus TaxID=1929088 RepID=A0ABT8ELF3_9BURK|nr:AI-2E family transporter [Alcaligenes endophyticus]MCX5590508.1 AI-2E family transporter [Alcaligenes endophyticus]MDN4122129.1 AI-2E family transporter [Alcaligenes endophyticus]